MTGRARGRPRGRPRGSGRGRGGGGRGTACQTHSPSYSPDGRITKALSKSVSTSDVAMHHHLSSVSHSGYHSSIHPPGYPPGAYGHPVSHINQPHGLPRGVSSSCDGHSPTRVNAGTQASWSQGYPDVYSHPSARAHPQDPRTHQHDPRAHPQDPRYHHPRLPGVGACGGTHHPASAHDTIPVYSAAPSSRQPRAEHQHPTRDVPVEYYPSQPSLYHRQPPASYSISHKDVPCPGHMTLDNSHNNNNHHHLPHQQSRSSEDMRGRSSGSGERLPHAVYHPQASGQHQEHFASDCDPRRPISQASPPPAPPPPDGAYTVHVADSHHPARAGSDSPRSGRSSGSQNVPSSHALPSSQQTRVVSYSRTTHTLPVLPSSVRPRRRLSDPEWGLRQPQEMTEPLVRTSSGSSQERRGRAHERSQRQAAFPPDATHGLHPGSHGSQPPNYVSLPGTEGQVSGGQTTAGSKGQCVPPGSFPASAGVYAALPGHVAKSGPYPAPPRREPHGYDTSGYGDHQPATHPPTSGSDTRKCAPPLGYASHRGSYTNSVDQDYSQFRIPRHPASSSEVNPARVQSPPPSSYPERVSSPPPPSPYSMQPPSPRQHPTRPVSPPPYSIMCPVSPHHPSSHGVQETPSASRSAVESRVAAASQQYVVPDLQQQQTARGQVYPVTYRRSSKEHVFVGAPQTHASAPGVEAQHQQRWYRVPVNGENLPLHGGQPDLQPGSSQFSPMKLVTRPQNGQATAVPGSEGLPYELVRPEVVVLDPNMCHSGQSLGQTRRRYDPVQARHSHATDPSFHSRPGLDCFPVAHHGCSLDPVHPCHPKRGYESQHPSSSRTTFEDAVPPFAREDFEHQSASSSHIHGRQETFYTQHVSPASPVRTQACSSYHGPGSMGGPCVSRSSSGYSSRDQSSHPHHVPGNPSRVPAEPSQLQVRQHLNPHPRSSGELTSGQTYPYPLDGATAEPCPVPVGPRASSKERGYHQASLETCRPESPCVLPNPFDDSIRPYNYQPHRMEGDSTAKNVFPPHRTRDHTRSYGSSGDLHAKEQVIIEQAQENGHSFRSQSYSCVLPSSTSHQEESCPSESYRGSLTMGTARQQTHVNESANNPMHRAGSTGSGPGNALKIMTPDQGHNSQVSSNPSVTPSMYLSFDDSNTYPAFGPQYLSGEHTRGQMPAFDSTNSSDQPMTLQQPAYDVDKGPSTIRKSPSLDSIRGLSFSQNLPDERLPGQTSADVQLLGNPSYPVTSDTQASYPREQMYPGQSAYAVRDHSSSANSSSDLTSVHMFHSEQGTADTSGCQTYVLPSVGINSSQSSMHTVSASADPSSVFLSQMDLHQVFVLEPATENTQILASSSIGQSAKASSSGASWHTPQHSASESGSNEADDADALIIDLSCEVEDENETIFTTTTTATNPVVITEESSKTTRALAMATFRPEVTEQSIRIASVFSLACSRRQRRALSDSAIQNVDATNRQQGISLALPQDPAPTPALQTTVADTELERALASILDSPGGPSTSDAYGVQTKITVKADLASTAGGPVIYDVGPQGTPSPDPLAELHRLMFSDVASPAVVEWGMKETTISLEPSGETSSHNIMRLEPEQPGTTSYYKDPGTPFSTFLKESTIPLSHYIRNPATPNVQHARDSNAALVSKVIEAAEAFTRENALQVKRTSEHSAVSENQHQNQNQHSAANQGQEEVGVTTRSATAEEINASPSFKTRPMPALIRDPVGVSSGDIGIKNHTKSDLTVESHTVAGDRQSRPSKEKVVTNTKDSKTGKREAVNKETREKSTERREGKVKLLDSQGSGQHSKQGLAKQHSKDSSGIKDKVKANWERLCESNNATKTPPLSVRKEGLREKENVVDKERRCVQLLPKPKAVKRCGQQQKLSDLGRSARTSGRHAADEDEKKSCGVRGRRGMKMSAKRRCDAGRAGSQDELNSDITSKLHERRGAWGSSGADVIREDKDEEDDVFTDAPEDDGTNVLHLTPPARKSEAEFFPDLSRTPSCGSSRGSSSSGVDEGDSDSVESRRRLASTCLSRTSSIGSNSDEKGEPIADTILPTVFPPRRQSSEKAKTADLLASFHEHQLRCLELEGQHYVVLEEVLSKCFPGLPRAQVERARLRDLNLLTRTLHLLGPGLAPEGSDSVSVLALADAAQLLHFFHGMMPCPGKDCMLTAPKPRGHLMETTKAAAGAAPSVCYHDKLGQRSRRSSSEGQHRFSVSESATFRKSSLSGRSKLDSMTSDDYDGNEEDAHSFTSEKTLFYCDGHPIFVYEDEAMAEQEQGTSDGEPASSPISSFKRGKIRCRASSYEADGEIMSVKEFREKSGFGYHPNSPDVYRSYPEVGDASPMLPSIPVYLSSPYTPGGGSLCHMPMDNERVLLECFSAPGSMAPSSVRSAPSVRLLSPDRPDLPPYEEDVFEGFPNNRLTSDTEYNHADPDPTDDLATPNAPAHFLHEQLGKASVPDIVVQPAHLHRSKYMDIGTLEDIASSEEPCSMHDSGEDKKFKNVSGDISKYGSQQVDETSKGASSGEKTVHRVEGLRSKRETSPGNIHERLSGNVAASKTEKHAKERKNEDGKFSAKKSTKSKKKDDTKIGPRDREKESKLAKDIVRRLRAIAKNGEKGSKMLSDTTLPSSESTSTGNVCSATIDVVPQKGVSRLSITLTSDDHVTTRTGVTIVEKGQPAPVIPGKEELLPADTLALVRKSSDTTTIVYGASDEEVETASRAGSIQTTSSDGDLVPEQLQSSARRQFCQKGVNPQTLFCTNLERLTKSGPSLGFKESHGNPPTSEKLHSPKSVPVCTRVEDFINQGSEYMSDAVGLVRSHSEPSLHSKSDDKVRGGLQVTGGNGRRDALVPPSVTVRSNSFPGASHSPKHLSEEEFVKNPPAPLLRMCSDMLEPSAQDDSCHSAPSLSPCTEVTIETSKDNQDVLIPRVKAGAELQEMALTPVGAKQTGSPVAEQVETREQPYDWTMPCAAHGEVCCPCEGLDVETVLDNVASPKVGPWLCTPGDELLYRCYSPRHLSMCASPRHSVAYMSPRHSTVCYSPRHSSTCYSPRPSPISYSPRPSPLAATPEELKTPQEETTIPRHEPSRLTVQVPGHDSVGSGVKRFASPNELPAAKRRSTEVQQKQSAVSDQAAEALPGSPQTQGVSRDVGQPSQACDSDLHHLAKSGVNIQEVHANQTEEGSLEKTDKLSVNLQSASDIGHLDVDSGSDVVAPSWHSDAEQSHPPKSLVVPTGTPDLVDSQTMNSKCKSLVMPIDSAKLNVAEADGKSVSSALAASEAHENIPDVSLATSDTYKNLMEARLVSETKMTCTETLEIKIITLSEDTRTKMTLTKMVSTKVTPTTTLGVLAPSHVEGELEEIETPVVVKPNIINSPRVKSPSKESSPDSTLARTFNQNSDQRERKIGLSLAVESNDFAAIEGEERHKTGGHRLAETMRASRSERRRHSASADSLGHVTRCDSMHSDMTPKMTVELKRSHSCDIEHPAVKRFKYNKEELLDFSGLPTLERQSFMSEAFKRLYKQEGLRECMKTAAGLYLQPMTGVYLHDMTVGYVEHVTSSRDPPTDDTPSSQCAASVAPSIQNDVVSSGCEPQTSCTSEQTGQPDPAPPLAPMDTMSQSEVSKSCDTDCSRATPIDDVEEALHQVQLSSSMSHLESESIADKDVETLAEEVKACCPGDATTKSLDDDSMDETNVPRPEGEPARAADHAVTVVEMNDGGEADSCSHFVLTDDLEEADDSAADCDHDTMSLDSGEEYTIVAIDPADLAADTDFIVAAASDEDEDSQSSDLDMSCPMPRFSAAVVAAAEAGKVYDSGSGVDDVADKQSMDLDRVHSDTVVPVQSVHITAMSDDDDEHERKTPATDSRVIMPVMVEKEKYIPDVSDNAELTACTDVEPGVAKGIEASQAPSTSPVTKPSADNPDSLLSQSIPIQVTQESKQNRDPLTPEIQRESVSEAEQSLLRVNILTPGSPRGSLTEENTSNAKLRRNSETPQEEYPIAPESQDGSGVESDETVMSPVSKSNYITSDISDGQSVTEVLVDTSSSVTCVTFCNTLSDNSSSRFEASAAATAVAAATTAPVTAAANSFEVVPITGQDGCLTGQHASRDEAAVFSPISERAETEVNVSGEERLATASCDASRGVNGGQSDLDGHSTNDPHLPSERISSKPTSEAPLQEQKLDHEQHVQAANVQNAGDLPNTSDPVLPEETATVLSQVGPCAAPADFEFPGRCGTSGTNTASTDLAASSVGNDPPRAGEENEVTGACSRPPGPQDTLRPNAPQPSESSEDFRMKAYLLEKMVEELRNELLEMKRKNMELESKKTS